MRPIEWSLSDYEKLWIITSGDNQLSGLFLCYWPTARREWMWLAGVGGSGGPGDLCGSFVFSLVIGDWRLSGVDVPGVFGLLC